MAASAASTYDQIYSMVKNGYTGDSTIWDQVYEYVCLHPNDLTKIAPNRKWAIVHQIIYHGGLKLFKRLLSLYDEKNQINIFSPTKDAPKPITILDIAYDRRGYYKEQYEYIERLFAQDKFIQACKTYNWPIIDEMLNKDRKLLNEKPPYYSNYFIHYLVLYDDVRKIDQYNLPDNRFQFDLKNADGKTALDLAREKKNEAIIDEIQKFLSAPPPEPDRFPDDREDDRDDASSLPSIPRYTVPVPARLPPETLRKITCRLTNKIFVDPVLASDGQTYERKAIEEYFENNRYSPSTGEAMDDIFTSDIQMKNLISDLRQQNKIP
jgi:hypothetical protein